MAEKHEIKYFIDALDAQTGREISIKTTNTHNWYSGLLLAVYSDYVQIQGDKFKQIENINLAHIISFCVKD